MRSLRKIPTRLRGTNFCPSLAYFAPSFVRQPNGTKCTQIVWNAPKLQFRDKLGGSGAFVAKNSDATSCHELLHQFGPFCTECGNTTKLSQMHSNSTNAPKHEVRVQLGESCGSLWKIPTRLHGTNFWNISARFAPSFVWQPNGTKSTHIVRNAPKHEFRS